MFNGIKAVSTLLNGNKIKDTLTRTNMTSQINQSSIIGAHEATINRSSREMERRRNRRER